MGSRDGREEKGRQGKGKEGNGREWKGKAYQLTMCFRNMPKRLASPLCRFVATMPGCTL